MTTIREIQQIATQTVDWTKKQVVENLLMAINDWQDCRDRLDDSYQDLHEMYTLLVDSYPKHPDDIPRSVIEANYIAKNAVNGRLKRMEEYSADAKAHAKLINKYLTFLGIWNENKEQLWEEIAQKEGN